MKANHPVQPARRRVGWSAGLEGAAALLQRALTRVPSRSNLHTGRRGESVREWERDRDVCPSASSTHKVRDSAGFLRCTSTSVLKSPRRRRFSQAHSPRVRVSRETRDTERRDGGPGPFFARKIFARNAKRRERYFFFLFLLNLGGVNLLVLTETLFLFFNSFSTKFESERRYSSRRSSLQSEKKKKNTRVFVKGVGGNLFFCLGNLFFCPSNCSLRSRQTNERKERRNKQLK